MGFTLKEYYVKYLTDIRKVSASTVSHYLDAINNISRNLQAKGLLKKNLYEVTTLEQLDKLWEILQNDTEFVEMNRRGHNMYGSGFRRYREFASGDVFKAMNDKAIDILDMPMEVSEKRESYHTGYQRSDIIRTQVIEYAHYKCEMDGNHETFIAARTNSPYMEAHHAIPISLQGRFPHSLDVYANVICLCPICHRKIHYGLLDDRRLMMDEIYEKRVTRLQKSGLNISKTEFENLIG